MAVKAAVPEVATTVRRRIDVRGLVQGVGFRPFVQRRATALGLAGWVRNAPEGVAVEVEGPEERIAALIEMLRTGAPTAARVDAAAVRAVPALGLAGFAIRDSVEDGALAAAIPLDLATCADCLSEMLDPADRRHRYPFLACTQCGPRYSVVEAMPYDRTRTTMRRFALCGDCRAEYEDPADRRFHAQAIACPACGPRLALWDPSGAVLVEEDGAIAGAEDALRRGGIVAVKGLGGFHLLADARNDEAVRALRTRKRRENKPFAVMFPDLATLSAACRVSPEEAALLAGPAAPIVLLQRAGGALAEAVAPDAPRIGAFLPYTPLHHLLLHDLGFPVVATSGNVSEEPIVTDAREALERLSGLADLFLVHDRPIARPLDDSVARVVGGAPMVLRRARGLAPAAIRVAGIRPGILGVGGHLKATVALSVEDGIVLGPHVGDLDGVAAREAHGRAADDLAGLHRVPVRVIARDMHPDYASRHVADAAGRPVVEVQHHLAHVAACMAEHGLEPPVLGIAWDGTGFGPDGTIWGGEAIDVTDAGWRRVAHLCGFRLPGGAVAVREPRRAALGLLFEVFGSAAFEMRDIAPVAGLDEEERRVLPAMLARGVNSPWTTSAGRLFDAFAALAGLRQRATYEGQAASELEGASEACEGPERGYRFPIQPSALPDGPAIVDWQPALEEALADIRAGATPGAVSAALHRGLAEAIAAIAVRAGRRRVALTGGCFQNGLLTGLAAEALRGVGCEPWWPRAVPPNDGGLALGQAAWAGWMERRGDGPCA